MSLRGDAWAHLELSERPAMPRPIHGLPARGWQTPSILWMQARWQCAGWLRGMGGTREREVARGCYRNCGKQAEEGLTLGVPRWSGAGKAKHQATEQSLPTGRPRKCTLPPETHPSSVPAPWNTALSAERWSWDKKASRWPGSRQSPWGFWTNSSLHSWSWQRLLERTARCELMLSHFSLSLSPS